MTDAEAAYKIVVVVVVIGILVKIGYDWLKSGRAKTGEYYMTTADCLTCREKCCVHEIKTAMNLHKQTESYQDSTVNARLATIEKRMDEAREDSAKLREDVSGIRSALDTMAGAFQVYAHRIEMRDRRTDDIKSAGSL
jgi:hypothetical protein